MAKRAKRSKLTPKEEAVITDVVRAVDAGEGFSVSKSVHRIYNMNKNSASVEASRKLNNEDFRNALMLALENRKIIGADSKVERVLDEGLDAENKGEPDHRTRLEYAKEINKIAGVYAPEKKETKSLNLNLNMDKEELTGRIRELQEELEV